MIRIMKIDGFEIRNINGEMLFFATLIDRNKIVYSFDVEWFDLRVRLHRFYAVRIRTFLYINISLSARQLVSFVAKIFNWMEIKFSGNLISFMKILMGKENGGRSQFQIVQCDSDKSIHWRAFASVTNFQRGWHGFDSLRRGNLFRVTTSSQPN